MNEFLKRTWAEINLDSLKYNISQIKNKLPQKTNIMAVVKADAYGHGDRYIAHTLVECGIDYFAVSNLDEALSLRGAGIKCNILILGFTPIQKANMLEKFNITQTVFSKEYARDLNTYCIQNRLSVRVHIKIDTGMGRIGLAHNELFDATQHIIEISKMQALHATGIFTHLSSADTLDDDSVAYTKIQKMRFDGIIARLKENGISFECVHLQNSAGIAFLDDTQYTHARAGIVIYGVAPSNAKLTFPIKPIMQLKSVVSMVKKVPPGTAISYGRKFVSSIPTKVATVPIGYGDGYPRLLSNKGDMLVHGNRVKVLGNVCMDQLMLDVSNITNVKQGDIVTVVGCDGDEQITMNELAYEIGTIGYELLCMVNKRVPRVYIKDEKVVAVVDYI